MKQLHYFLYLFIFLLTVTNGFSVDYFVSNSGNDNNKGTSESNPFRTIQKINSLQLKPGDRILFQRNNTFKGALRISVSGTIKNPIIISTYGKGKQPVFSGALPLNGVSKRSKDLYVSVSEKPVKQLYINNQYQHPCRYPDPGYLFIDKDSELKTELFDEALSTFDKSIEGATIRIQTVNWQWEIRNIAELTGNRVILDSALWHKCRKNFGYYLENKPQFCNQPGEWYYDEKNKNLLVNLQDNDKLPMIEGVVFNNGILVEKGVSNIIIRDIQIKKYHNAGIKVAEKSENITIKNCTISETEVFGIEFETDCRNCLAVDNRILDIRGRGISMTEPEYCKVNRNSIRRIGLVPGHGFDGVNSGIGIALMNIEFRDSSYTNLAHNNVIAYNRIDSTGYCGIRMDGHDNIAEYNVMKDALLTMNDGAGFYCWGKNYDYTFNNIIRNNIVERVHGSTASAAGNHNMTFAYYVDNRCRNLVLNNNVALGVKGGINLNDGSNHITVKNNILYGPETGIVMTVFGKQYNDKIRGMHDITNNTIYLKHQEDVAIRISNNLGVDFNPGRIDSNLYVNYCYPKIFETNEKNNERDLCEKHTLENWQKNFGFDENARVIVPQKGDRWWEHEDISYIFVNDSDSEKTIDAKVGYTFNVQQQKHEKAVRLQPFSAIILMHESIVK